MKTLATLAALAALVATFAVANRPLDDGMSATLANLQALDGTNMESTKAALTTINEHALNTPADAAVLRAEDAVAGVALRLHGEQDVTVARR